ncbi:hypothetical protein BD410DRAFT_903192, partial [Rickenella mellea]
MSVTRHHLRLAFKAFNSAATAQAASTKIPIGVVAKGGFVAQELGIDRPTKDVDIDVYTLPAAWESFKPKLVEAGIYVKDSSSGSTINATWTDPSNKNIHVGLDLHQQDPQYMPKDKILSMTMDKYTFQFYDFVGFLEIKIKAASRRESETDTTDIEKICQIRKVALIESVKNKEINVTDEEL